MATELEPTLFPAPPQKSSTHSRCDSITSSFSQKDLDFVEPSPFRDSRSSGINELATMSDVRLVCEYVAVLKKGLQDERKRREKEVTALKLQMERVQHDCSIRRSSEEQKFATLQSAFEKLKDCPKAVESMRQQMDNIDKSMLDFRSSMSGTTMDADYDRQREWSSSSRTELGEETWSAQCIFVLDASRPNVYEVDGTAYLKLQHGRPVQNILFSGDSSLAFVLGVERAFSDILRCRAWMPLSCEKKPSRSQSSFRLSRLDVSDRNSQSWTRKFLEEKCLTFDMHGRAHIYVALQNDTLSLSEIQSLTVSTGAAPDLRSTPISSGPRLHRSRKSISGSNSAERKSPTLQTSFSSSPPKRDDMDRSGSVSRRKPRPKIPIAGTTLSTTHQPPGPPPVSPPPTPPAWVGLQFAPVTLPNIMQMRSCPQLPQLPHLPAPRTAPENRSATGPTVQVQHQQLTPRPSLDIAAIPRHKSTTTLLSWSKHGRRKATEIDHETSQRMFEPMEVATPKDIDTPKPPSPSKSTIKKSFWARSRAR